MRRYIDFRGEDWGERTDSRMQAVRWEACVDGFDPEPPMAGVIDGYPDDLLRELAAEGWLPPFNAPDDPDAFRAALAEAVMRTVAEDVDTLSAEEHALAQRMLAEGYAALESVAELEAGYTLRMRLWCDLGMYGGEPCARLDPRLEAALPALMARRAHTARRARIALFDRQLESLLYIAGHVDMRPWRARFISEVMEGEPGDAMARLAWNHLEASFDTYVMDGRTLLVHVGLADPEAAAGILAAGDGVSDDAETLANQTGWHGLLPEEMRMDEKLQRALDGALRPEWASYEASRDLRLLAKQGAPLHVLQETMASMLCVLPTQHMDSTLSEMRQITPRWVHGLRPGPRDGGQPGLLQ